MTHYQKYGRKWYLANKAKSLASRNDRRHRLRDWIRALKASQGCNRCGERHPACLDHHHVDPSTKDPMLRNNTRSSRVPWAHGWRKDRILAEIAKCEVLCANCHRKEHYKEA